MDQKVTCSLPSRTYCYLLTAVQCSFRTPITSIGSENAWRNLDGCLRFSFLQTWAIWRGKCRVWRQTASQHFLRRIVPFVSGSWSGLLIWAIISSKSVLYLLRNSGIKSFLDQSYLLSLQLVIYTDNSSLIAACRTQALKVDVIEQRLSAVTYTGPSQAALRAVSQHLDAAEAKAKAKLKQAST